MSKNEDFLLNIFCKNQILFETQKPVPITDYPWKTERSRTPPKSDFYLPEYNLYIEVKGFMTIEAMSKMKFLSKQKLNYYIFQCTEFEWNPFLCNNITGNDKSIKNNKSKSVQLQININEQISELCCKNKNYLNNISQVTEVRLDDFIRTKVNQFISWNGNWV